MTPRGMIYTGLLVWVSAWTWVACASATPTPQATGCIARYQLCASGSHGIQEYVWCRQAVDVDCLPGMDGGVHE